MQKAGTTWWFSLLEQHPQVYNDPRFHKERHFFSHFWMKEFSPPHSVEEYYRWFPRPVGMVTGEWTPDYAHYPWVAPLLRIAAPSAALLVLLRDPVERYQSGLAHHAAHGDRLDPQRAADAFARGLYAKQLQPFESAFGAERLLVLQYERCCRSPLSMLAETFRFLCLDDTFEPENAQVVVSPTGRANTLTP